MKHHLNTLKRSQDSLVWSWANLLLQSLHGHVLNVLSLFADPVGLIRDHERQDDLHQDEHMLHAHE